MCGVLAPRCLLGAVGLVLGAALNLLEPAANILDSDVN